MSEAEKAAEVLGDDSGADDAGADVDAEPTDFASEEPDGFRRLFRTDRALDLNERVPWWDPDKGGMNRIGAALKQMGGWEYIPPIVWLLLGMLETAYNGATDYLRGEGMFDVDTDDDQEQTDEHPNSPDR